MAIFIKCFFPKMLQQNGTVIFSGKSVCVLHFLMGPTFICLFNLEKTYLGDRTDYGLTFFYTFLLNISNKYFKRMK